MAHTSSPTTTQPPAWHIEDPHAHAAQDVQKRLATTMSGLSGVEAQARLAALGYNELVSREKNNPLLVFLKQFNSVLVYILLLAALISYLFDHVVDTYVILVIVVLNACLGFTQEYRAQRAIEALKRGLVQRATVLRDGEVVEISARELVVGDVILLEAGMSVPADARLLELHNFEAMEASLTGESLPVSKRTEPVASEKALGDRLNMVWMGTTIARGTARAVVVATGSGTAIGKVATLLEDVDETASHFQTRTRALALQMGVIALASASLVFVVGYFVRGIAFAEMFLFTIATLVSGIPEGLPAILSVVLAVGAYRISKRRALVRSLPATETLGVTTTIVTDKTGTLTQNVMMVERVVYNAGEEEVAVTGIGWEPKGEFFRGEAQMAPLEHRPFAKLLHIAGTCSGAHVRKHPDVDTYEVVGDPTEAALTVLARKAGLEEPILFAHERMLSEIPFASETRWHAKFIELREHGAGFDNYREIYVSGAPETLFELSSAHLYNGVSVPLTATQREAYAHTVERMSRDALRVIAIAFKTVSPDVADIATDDVRGLTLAGLVGMKDPLRKEVPDAVLRANEAGIRVIMATGDHKTTALAIAKEAGIVPKTAHAHEAVMTGAELEELSDHELSKVVHRVSVFARLEPKTKLRIARALQGRGEVVAMTGDGVNDALALKQADIGIAMGKVGTDVARQSADIVLTDDNFASIVDAVHEGRTVFTNTRQSATFLVSTSFAEHATILGTLALGMPLPLLPTQILWLNLVTDGVAGVPLALEPARPGTMRERPRKKLEHILSLEVVPFMLVMVSVMAVGTITVFSLFLPEGIDKARTGAFAVMAFTQLFNMFNLRALHDSLFSIGLFSNRPILYGLGASLVLTGLVLYLPFLQRVFSFESLRVPELLGIILLSSLVLWFGELYKHVRTRIVRSMARPVRAREERA